MMRRLILIGLFLLASCGGANPTMPTPDQTTFRVRIMGSDPLADPAVTTGCWGGFQFPVSWENLPANTQSIAVVMRGEYDANKKDFVFAVIYNLAPATNLINIETKLNSRGGFEGRTYNGTVGKNGFGTSELLSPCSTDQNVSYQAMIKIYALDLPPTLAEKMTLEQLETAIQGHILATAERNTLFLAMSRLN